MNYIKYGILIQNNLMGFGWDFEDNLLTGQFTVNRLERF